MNIDFYQKVTKMSINSLTKVEKNCLYTNDGSEKKTIR